MADTVTLPDLPRLRAGFFSESLVLAHQDALTGTVTGQQIVDAVIAQIGNEQIDTHVTVTPDAAIFDETIEGGHTVQIMTFKNIHDQDIALLEVTTFGDFTVDFTPKIIVPQGTVSIPVTFRPTGVGNRQGVIVFRTNQRAAYSRAFVSGMCTGKAGLGKNGYGIYVLGDSITQTGILTGTSWIQKFCMLIGQRLIYRGSFAVGGATTADVERLQLPELLKISPRPRAVAICAGTNDLTDGAIASGIATIKRIGSALEAVGIQPLISTVPPGPGVGLIEVSNRNWNRNIEILSSQKRYPIIDMWAALKAPNSYAIHPASATYDQTHPNPEGSYLIAAKAARDFPAWGITDDGDYALATADTPFYASNSLFEDLDGNGIPDGASTQGAITLGCEKAQHGNWIVASIPAGTAAPATAIYALAQKFTRVSELVGKKIRIGGRLVAYAGPNFAGSNIQQNNGKRPSSVLVQFVNSNDNWKSVLNVFICGVAGAATETGIFNYDGVVPPHTTHVSINICQISPGLEATNYDRYVRLSQLTIRPVDD